MTVDFIIKCICVAGEYSNGLWHGLPELKVSNTNRPHTQYWRAQCPKCGRGGIIDYPSAFKCLDAWNKMQKDLYRAQGIEIPFAQPEQPSGRKACFTAPQCSCHDCPNAWHSEAVKRYGENVADDMGMERIPCKECHYNTGKCEDCLFQGNPDYCPEESEGGDGN